MVTLKITKVKLSILQQSYSICKIRKDGERNESSLSLISQMV